MRAAEGEIGGRGLRWSQLGVEKDNQELTACTSGWEDEVWPEPAADGRLIPMAHPCWLLRKDLS
jgi:hypothetical protein